VNLEDVIDSEAVNSVHSLQQDEWSLSRPTFGEEGQLQVVGWSGRNKWSAKYYILKCIKCSQDSELFGEGYFRSLKCHIVRGKVPCGCSKKPLWSQGQFFTMCSRKATELGYTFLGFVGEWNGAHTKIKMSCENHGEWSSGIIYGLINGGRGCLWCGVGTSTKPDDIMITSFYESKAFHPDTEFWRSERKSSEGKLVYWCMSCPICGEVGESKSYNLQIGQRPCACSKQRQQECYINWIVDENNNAIALKFGIARDSKQRIKNQDRQSAYEVRQYQVYSFPSVADCKQAERECKKELETGVVLKRDMPDGWTETTWSYNIGKVKSIYERNGGVLL